MGGGGIDPFVAVTPNEVTDIDLLPNLVRILTTRVEETLAALNDKVIPGIAQICARLDDLEDRALTTERRIIKIEERLDKLEGK